MCGWLRERGPGEQLMLCQRPVIDGHIQAPDREDKECVDLHGLGAEGQTVPTISSE